MNAITKLSAMNADTAKLLPSLAKHYATNGVVTCGPNVTYNRKAHRYHCYRSGSAAFAVQVEIGNRTLRELDAIGKMWAGKNGFAHDQTADPKGGNMALQLDAAADIAKANKATARVKPTTADKPTAPVAPPVAPTAPVAP